MQIQFSLRFWFFPPALTLHVHSLPAFSVRSKIEDGVKVYACNIMVGQIEGQFFQLIRFFGGDDLCGFGNFTT